MFLNKTMLKKFIKSSFKWEGLTVGRIYGGLVVAGGTWVTWTEDGYIPNWLKAAIMEFAGELPREGILFKTKKDEAIQYEIPNNELYDLPTMKHKSRYAYTVTPVVIDEAFKGTMRLLQQTNTLQMLAIPEDKYQVIDLSELGEENAPSGPASVSDEKPMLIYKNEHSAYAFLPLNGLYGIGAKVSGYISGINFDKEAEK